jgi:hypothetical protein
MHGNNRNNQPNAFELTAEQLAPFWATEKAALEDAVSVKRLLTAASQRNDPSEDATMEISLDLDFTIALAKSYPGLANEINIEDGKPSLDTFFGLIQPFIDCIDSLTVETNPTINEVHL